MPTFYPAIHEHGLLVLQSRSQSEGLEGPEPTVTNEPLIPRIVSNSSGMPIDSFETRTIRISSPVVSVVSTNEIYQEYHDLGNALKDLKELADDEDWGIEKPVFDSACQIAGALMQLSIPAPRIFTHGQKSVVFNWSDSSGNNLYFTISSDELSVLISSRERIKKRDDYLIRELPESSKVFVESRLAFLDRPIFLTHRSSSDFDRGIEYTQA